MNAPERAGLAAALQCDILERIPLARAMQLRVTRYDGDVLELAAPLAPNVNDKGCAFGGSLASLMTLTGWGLIELALRARGLDCDVYIGDSQLRYRAPVWGELVAEAHLADDADFDGFFSSLERRGKARLDVACAIAGEDGPAATLDAAFVAKMR